ncbi:hypothetical protein EIP86_001756 [Pleurotus ostreatoroseus]|nr:hypothetical protein EIP86_001756 [Pleurotus ostreatoroseus]
MSYLSNQVLYVGSHMGNPQILQIHATAQAALDTDTLPIPSDISTVSSKELTDASGDVEMEDAAADKRSYKGKIVKTRGSFVEVLDSYPNIAPIVDAVLADADGISTLRESLLFRLDGRTSTTRLTPESASFILDKPTIALGNVRKRAIVGGKSTYADSNRIVQVTPHAVTLVEYDPVLETFHRVGPYWTPGTHNVAWAAREIVAASVNATQVVIALSGGAVAVLNLNENGHLTFLQHREFVRQEISALSCAPLDPTKNFSLYIAVAFWGSNVIRLLTLDPSTRLQDIGDPQKFPTLPSLPRSVLLHNFGTGNRPKDPDYHPYVVAGLADGSVACFNMKGNELKDMKLFPLGTAPVTLVACDIDDKRAVFANGSQSSVLYWDKQRLRQSYVMVKNIAAGASFNTGAFPSCQVLATPSSLLIGQIRGVDKMQIRNIPLGLDNPKRIAYSAEHKAFGVGCSRTTPSRIGDGASVRNSFILFDDTNFDRLSEFICDADEEVSATLALKGGSQFLVGTVRHQVGETEPSAGRLLLFAMEPGEGTARGERRRALDLKLLASCDAEGCVYALVEVSGAIATAVNTSVDLYRIIDEDAASSTSESTTRLARVSRWNHNYFVTSLAARDDKIIAGDAISSVSIVRIKGNDLETIARNYGPLWPVAVEAGRNKSVIGANCDCNLFTLSISQQKTLQLDGNFYLGDVVNRILPGRLNAQDEHESQMFEPEHLFFTSSGRIGVIHHVNTQIAMLLTHLQNNMSDILTGPGGVNHSRWRTPANSRGRTDADAQAIGFLDGDFLEQFLTYFKPNKLLGGVRRIEKPREEIEAVLEKLQSLH